MDHPFADLIGLEISLVEDKYSEVRLTPSAQLHNPHHVVHGAILYGLADTGMGAALYPSLGQGELCATIEIKMSYFKPARDGEIICKTYLLNRGKRVANLESELLQNDILIAKANGNYSIFTPSAS